MKKVLNVLFTILLSFSYLQTSIAQTDVDGLSMEKNSICGGLIYGYSTWDTYWEGTFKRKNANIGNINTNMAIAMVNYGLTNKINIIAMAPYISNTATAGTLIGAKGIQDLSFILKYEALAKKIMGLDVSIFTNIGTSIPLSNYVNDYLPLSIGSKSNQLLGRLLVDAQKNNWFGAASISYTHRGNVKIDRDFYYTNELIYSNDVLLPNIVGYNVRAGWRKGADLVLELVYDGMNSLGGYDIRKNDMPFLNNNMKNGRIGINTKLPIPKVNGLSFMGSAMATLYGRNMGKTSTFTAGLVYQATFKKKVKI